MHVSGAVSTSGRTCLPGPGLGFGRRHLAVSPDELTTDVLYQIGALDAFCRPRTGRRSGT